jgi:hypothetical protein
VITWFEAYLERLTSDSKTVDNDNDLEEDPIGTHTMAKHPSYPHLDIKMIVQDFGASQFLTALYSFHYHQSPPPYKSILSNQFDHFDAYKVLKVCLLNSPTSGHFSEHTWIHATHIPGGSGDGYADGRAGFNMVLVRTEGVVNQVMKDIMLDSMWPFLFDYSGLDNLNNF